MINGTEIEITGISSLCLQNAVIFRHNQIMNRLNWIREIQWQETLAPLNDIQGEELYTLYLSDFRHLPDIDYGQMAIFDPQLRVLLN